MGVVYEEFIRCTCDNATFREEKQVTVHKKVLKRSSLLLPIASIDEEYRYFCTKCNEELDR